MFNLRKEIIKKNIFLILSSISSFIFVASLMCTIMGENSPVKFLVNESPVKSIISPLLIFFITFTLYRKSKNSIKENTK